MTAARSVVVVLGLLGLCACGSGSEPAQPAARGALRCGDFITLEDLKRLGLDGTRFDPNETQRDVVLGVRCQLGHLSATVFYGEQFPAMAKELNGAVASGQIKSHPGPTIGSETYWTWLGELHGLLFLSSDKRFAGSLAGRDQGLLERLAARLDANMKRR